MFIGYSENTNHMNIWESFPDIKVINTYIF